MPNDCRQDDKEKPEDDGVIITVGLTALNIFLMPILGYLVPAVLFFVLNFTIFKLTKSQPFNVIFGGGRRHHFFCAVSARPWDVLPHGHFGLDFGVS